MRTHVKDPLPDHGYTHWWMMFNPRQLLVHSQILEEIISIQTECGSLDVKEQVMGIFQQYLRNQNMFSIWNMQRDTPEPFFSEDNYNPKQLTIENSVFSDLGRGNWESSSSKCIGALSWSKEPWERIAFEEESGKTTSSKVFTEDVLRPGSEITCSSSADLAWRGPWPQPKSDRICSIE